MVATSLVEVVGYDESLLLEFLDGESDLLDGEVWDILLQFLICGISPVESVDEVSVCLFVFVDEVGDFGVDNCCV